MFSSFVSYDGGEEKRTKDMYMCMMMDDELIIYYY